MSMSSLVLLIATTSLWIYIILLVDFFLDKEVDIRFTILLALCSLPVDNSALSKVAVF